MARKIYKVFGSGLEFLSPEETLVDSYSLQSKLERPIDRRVFSVLFFFLILLMAVFSVGLGKLAIKENKKWEQLAIINRSVIYSLPPGRGEIFDRQGQIVATSQPVFDLIAVNHDLPTEEKEWRRWQEELARILDMPLSSLSELMARERSQALWLVRRELTKEQALQVENLFSKGFYVLRGAKRFYPQGSFWAHLIGFTGKVSPEDLKAERFYQSNDRIGRAGLEKSYESFLRGEHGQIFFDRSGQPYQVRSAQPGHSLIANVDQKIQNDLFGALEEVLKINDLKRGAAVALNPQTGAVLGMVSFPSFDNSQLTGELGQEIYQQYFLSGEKPLFNRAVGGKYNPGSTIKPLLALAGLQEKVITPQTAITDLTGYITVPNLYRPEEVYTFRDWKIQGRVDLKKALAQSSDIYFYSLGGGYGEIEGLGFARLEKYFRKFGIDRLLGIDLPGENTGFVPNEEWKKEQFGQPWFLGDTYNVSIGQGDLTVTPLWLASYISALANGGKIFQPQIVQAVVDIDKKNILSFTAKLVADLNLDPEQLRVIQEALREVVISGTGQLLKDLPVAVAAKTGTAEVAQGKELNSLLVAYAPYDYPEIALAVVIEKVGSRQGLALQVAKTFFQKYFTYQQ